MQGLAQLEGMVAALLDILNTRVEGNLRSAARVRLLDVPPGRVFGREEFFEHQLASVKHHTERLVIRQVVSYQI